MAVVAWRFGVIPTDLVEQGKAAVEPSVFLANARAEHWAVEVWDQTRIGHVHHRPLLLVRGGDRVVALFSRRALRLRYLEAMARLADQNNGARGGVVFVFRESWRADDEED